MHLGGLAGEASATSWKAIPVRDAVSKADAIVRGKVASVEPLDVNSNVVEVKVAAVLKGDMPKDAMIRVVATHRGAKGVHRFREGEEGIWLATKLPDREAYAVSGHPVSFQPVAAARVIELLVAGTSRRAMSVLDVVLAREPEKTESRPSIPWSLGITPTPRPCRPPGSPRLKRPRLKQGSRTKNDPQPWLPDAARPTERQTSLPPDSGPAREHLFELLSDAQRLRQTAAVGRDGEVDVVGRAWQPVETNGPASHDRVRDAETVEHLRKLMDGPHEVAHRSLGAVRLL